MGPTYVSVSDVGSARVSALVEAGQSGSSQLSRTVLASSANVAGSAPLPQLQAATPGVAALAASASCAAAPCDNPWDERTVASQSWPAPPAARPCLRAVPPAPKSRQLRAASSQRTPAEQRSHVWPGLPTHPQPPSSQAVVSQEAWPNSNWSWWDTGSGSWQSGATSWEHAERPQRSVKWDTSGAAQPAQSEVTGMAAAAAPGHMPVATVAPPAPLPAESASAAPPRSPALAGPTAVPARPTMSPWALPLRGVPAGYAAVPADVAMVPPPVLHPQAAAPGPATATQRPWFQLISDTHADWCGAIVVLHGGSVLSRSWGTWFALQGPGPMQGPWNPAKHSWLRLASVNDSSNASALAALRARPNRATGST